MRFLAMLFMLSLFGCGDHVQKETPKPQACECCKDGTCDASLGCKCAPGNDPKEPGGGCGPGGCPHPLVASALLCGALGCATIPHVAAEAHEFDLPVIHSQTPGPSTYSSAAHQGKPIALEFFFNGCSYCNKNAPNVDQLVTATHAEVVEVTIDCEQSQWDQWVARHNPLAPVLNGCNSGLDDYYGVNSFPTVIVLGPEHHEEVFRFSGVWDAATKRRLRQILGG